MRIIKEMINHHYEERLFDRDVNILNFEKFFSVL